MENSFNFMPIILEKSIRQMEIVDINLDEFLKGKK